MISGNFNNGWGDDVPLRQLQNRWMRSYLARFYQDRSRTVIIDSVWYTEEYHTEVLIKLQNIRPDRIIITSLMDPAIIDSGRYDGLGCEVIQVGYHPGIYELDAWALICYEYFSSAAETDPNKIVKPFVCYNRKPHPHRRRLFRDLEANDVLRFGTVTMGKGSQIGLHIIEGDASLGSNLAPNGTNEHYGIVNDIMTLGPMHIWNSSFLNLVTETVYDVDQQWFVSEKIYKPVLGMRPFLVYAPGGASKWLGHIGLETFVNDFADISDLDLKQPQNIAAFVKTLCDQPQSYFRHKYLALLPKIAYNKEHFHRHATEVRLKIEKGI